VGDWWVRSVRFELETCVGSYSIRDTNRHRTHLDGARARASERASERTNAREARARRASGRASNARARALDDGDGKRDQKEK